MFNQEICFEKLLFCSKFKKTKSHLWCSWSKMTGLIFQWTQRCLLGNFTNSNLRHSQAIKLTEMLLIISKKCIALKWKAQIVSSGSRAWPEVYIYIYAFSRRFYPKRLTLHSSYSFLHFISSCFPWESNP